MNAAMRKHLRPLRFLLRVVLLVVVPVIAGIVALHLYARGGRYVETENAYLKAHVVAVTPEISGRVVWVGVEDNQLVKVGQPLLKIDPKPFQIAVAQAEARLDITRTDIETLRASYREAVVDEALALERVQFADKQLKRQKTMLDRKVGSQERYDQAKYDLDSSRRERQSAQAKIRRVLVGLGGKADLPVTDHPRFLQAQAELDEAKLNLSRAEIAAAANGVVSNMKLQVGEYVEEAEPIFSLVQSGRVWVEANLKETQLTHVREGQKATVELDAYPDNVWPARVATIAPATGAEFALLPPQNATGNWVKVVQRVPVLLEIEPAADAPPLRAGMTATISIDTEHRRQLHPIVRRTLGEEGLPEPVRGLVQRAIASFSGTSGGEQAASN